MYEGMGGEYWYIKDNWGNISESYCNWAGISCNEKCHVDEIIFIANNLIYNYIGLYYHILYS